MKGFAFFIFLLFFPLILSATSYSAQVTLAWDSNTDPALVGYTLYYGTSSGNYASSISLGKVTTYTVNNLSDGVAYFFALTARNTAGLESGYSNEVNYTPALSQFTLTVSSTGSGSGIVNKSPAGTAFNAGTLVSLTAAANANSVFTGWSGACSGTANPCKVTVNSNTAVTAAFALKTFAITATAGSGGSISPAGGININQGASQTFTITPTTGYQIAGVTVDGVSQGAIGSYTFTNVTAAHTIQAAFTNNTVNQNKLYTLKIFKKGSGKGAVVNNPLGATFKAGTVVTLTPLTDPDSAFGGWSGACSGSSDTCTVTMSANRSVTAAFDFKTYSITATAGSDGSITPSGKTTVTYGGSQVYSITPGSGFQVNEVLVDGNPLGALTSYTFNTITSAHTIQATFTKKTETPALFQLYLPIIKKEVSQVGQTP